MNEEKKQICASIQNNIPRMKLLIFIVPKQSKSKLKSLPVNGRRKIFMK